MNLRGLDKWLCIITDNPILSTELDFYLKEGSKIQAIKCYRNWCLGMSTISFDALFVDQPDWNKKEVTLRICKDTIDLYAIRLNVTTKTKRLRKRIENWCNKNGYDKMGNDVERKNDDGTIYYKRTDWEMVDDIEGNLINDDQWMPHPNLLIKMNKLWKRYR
jgi:hypothetical protein